MMRGLAGAIADRNYRGISWGVDASGFGVSLRYVGRL